VFGRGFVSLTLRVRDIILEFRAKAKRKQILLLGISQRLVNGKVESPSDSLLPESVLEIMKDRDM